MIRSPDPLFWRGKSVLITGHTGFKGGWLALWLTQLGAQVHGYALEPSTRPNFFSLVHLPDLLSSSQIADIADAEALERCIAKTQPEIIFHLAAQPLVRESYRNPLHTFVTNVMGCLHLLEAVRKNPANVRAVVNVTSDKCYAPGVERKSHVESDAMGGLDPYSCSKGCAELISASYRNSYFLANQISLATARAGNVIGGGDWAADRLLPDFFRAITAGQTLRIRYPSAVRPWQHVLEPVSGYLLLAEGLYQHGKEFAEPWNFGPRTESAKSVQWILENLKVRFPMARWEAVAAGSEPRASMTELNFLSLDSAKAESRLGWSPRWNLQDALTQSADWYQSWKSGLPLRDASLRQIESYVVWK